MIMLRVNGRMCQVDCSPDTPLLWVIREQLQLTGTKYSCGIGSCGSCTVLINNEAIMSCVTTVAEVEGAAITTIEGAHGTEFEALRRAWIAEDVPQCGYCQPGQLLTATAMLKTLPHPDRDTISATMSGVLCRCGSYRTIQRAIHRAIEDLDHENR